MGCIFINGNFIIFYLLFISYINRKAIYKTRKIHDKEKLHF